MPADRVTRETPWHIVFLIDDSASMQDKPSEAVNEALRQLFSELAMMSGGTKHRVKVSIVAFGSSADLVCEAKRELDIEGDDVAVFAGSRGTTNASAAFGLAEAVLLRNGGRPTDFEPFVFFFSDGAPDDEGAAVAAADRIKALQLSAGRPRIVSVGVGPNIRVPFMERVATNPEMFKHLQEPAEIVKFLPQIGTVLSTVGGGAQAVEAGIINL